MEGAPYPGLDPDLWPIARDLAAAPPAHTLPIATLRAQLDDLAARAPFTPPPGLTIQDWQIDVADRAVRLRHYRPAGAGDDAMLYMHGGGWALGSIEGHDQICADLAHSTGLHLVSIDYALAPEHPYPVALNECVAAFEWLAGDTSPLGVVRRLWVGGDSAGGNLALATCLRLRDMGANGPDGLFLAYPCTDDLCASPSHQSHATTPFLSSSEMAMFWSLYLAGAPADPYAAPARATPDNLPTSVIVTAGLDPLVDEGDALATTIAATGTDVWHRQAPGLGHSFLRFRHASPLAEAAFQDAASAIRDRLP